MLCLGIAREAHSYTQLILLGGSLGFSVTLLCLRTAQHGQRCTYAYANTLSGPRSSTSINVHLLKVLRCSPGSFIEYEREVGQGDHMQHHHGQYHGGLAGHVRVRQQVLRPFHACSRHSPVNPGQTLQLLSWQAPSLQSDSKTRQSTQLFMFSRAHATGRSCPSGKPTAKTCQYHALPEQEHCSVATKISTMYLKHL